MSPLSSLRLLLMAALLAVAWAPLVHRHNHADEHACCPIPDDMNSLCKSQGSANRGGSALQSPEDCQICLNMKSRLPWSDAQAPFVAFAAHNTSSTLFITSHSEPNSVFFRRPHNRGPPSCHHIG